VPVAADSLLLSYCSGIRALHIEPVVRYPLAYWGKIIHKESPGCKRPTDAVRASAGIFVGTQKNIALEAPEIRVFAKKLIVSTHMQYILIILSERRKQCP
jgi:hypothetical protein